MIGAPDSRRRVHREVGAAERVALFRALQLGDMLCAVPALRALRALWPGARVTLVGLPWAAAFAARFCAYVDDFLAFPGAPGLPEQPVERGALERFLEAARARRFDLAVQMHGSGAVTGPLVQAMGARRNGGFAPPHLRAGGAGFLPYPEGGSEVERLLRLARHLGAGDHGHELEFPLQPQDLAELGRLAAAGGVPGRPFACLHPGARTRVRQWGAERFAAVADRLVERGLEVVLTGSAAERGLTAAVAGAMDRPCRNLAGRTSLGGLAALLSRARLLVCNDTGVSHLAAALGVPSVVVFTASERERWAPLNPSRHLPVSVRVGCRPCTHARCPIGHPCATGVTVEAVVGQAERLLAS